MANRPLKLELGLDTPLYWKLDSLMGEIAKHLPPGTAFGVQEDYNKACPEHDVDIVIDHLENLRLKKWRRAKQTTISLPRSLVAIFPLLQQELDHWVPHFVRYTRRQLRFMGPNKPPVRPTVRITLMTKSEMELGEAFIKKCAYNIEFPVVSVSQVHVLYRIAKAAGHEFFMERCFHLLTHVPLQRMAAECGIAMGYGPDRLTCQPTFIDKGKNAVMLQLADLVATLNNKVLAAQWLKLPYVALLELLNGQSLRTDSEDTVLTAVSMWADANKPPAVEARCLLEQIRLLQLSKTMFYSILPQLEWPAKCCAGSSQASVLPNSELLRLAAYSVGDKHMRQSLTQPGIKPELPGNWLCNKPRLLAKGVKYVNELNSDALQKLPPNVRWRLKEDDIRPLLAPQHGYNVGDSNGLRGPEPLFAHGLYVRPSLEVNLKSQSVGLYANPTLPVKLKPTCLPAKSVWRLSLTLVLANTGAEGKLLVANFDEGTLMTQGWGQKMFTFTDPALPITSIGAWKKQLMSARGQLEVEMTVKATKSKMVPEK